MKRLAALPMYVRFLVAFVFLLCPWQMRTATAQERFVSAAEFRIWKNFHSKFLSTDRDVMAWLPPGYDAEPTKHYPVLYMHDGGSVFVLWRIDEIAKPLIASGEVEPLIIVMVYNGGAARTDEYTPSRPARSRFGGKADAYGRMLVEELKPFIDSELRTLTDAANTGVGGASLGGIASLYLGLKYPRVFGKLGVMSPSVWWDDKLMVRSVKGLKSKPDLRIWLDTGTDEGPRTLPDAKELRDALITKGWTLNSDLMYFEAKGATHDEESFAKRAAPLLKFLFPGHAQN
ncbi:MAG TPA: alpha/beta hydrolase-fold protein [Pyrinomonadaceae bacterium]|nr:alpha/beta hydrolase-fold protein [Pyrinomonadaceae bacterium]